MTTHFADDKTLAELMRLERELAEAEKQINVLIAGLTEQTVRADENAAYAERLKAALQKIHAIPNQDFGHDWEEIDQARAIAYEALAAEGVDRNG